MAPEDIKYYGKLNKKDEVRVHEECDYLEKKYGYQCSYCSDSECGEGVEFYK